MAKRRGPSTPGRIVEAYVLRTTDLGDADRVVVLLCASEGRIDGVLKGARRPRRGLGAALEPLSWVRAEYRERPGRDLVSISNVELERSMFNLAGSPEALGFIAHLAELAHGVSMPGDSRPKHVRLLHAVLATLTADNAADPATLEVLAVYYDLWIARLEGIWPGLETCGDCGKGLNGGRRVGVLDQGALCSECAPGHQQVLPLSGAAAALAARCLRSAPGGLLTDPPTRRAVLELRRLAAALLTVHLDREFRTLPAPGIIRIRHS